MKVINVDKIEPQRKKIGLRGFRAGPTQTELYIHRGLEISYLECTGIVLKKNALISSSVTAQLICAFVLAYAKN